MKKVICFLVIICFAGYLYPGEKLLTSKELESKTAEELYLMRNKIYAKHGRPFKTYELDSYFHSNLPDYKPDLKFSESRLSAIEKQNIKAIREAEKKLISKAVTGKKDGEEFNFSAIINTWQYGKFSSAEKATLEKNGLILYPSEFKQFYHLYDENQYKGIASYVTVDSVAQLFHLFFDTILADTEVKNLMPKLEALCSELNKEMDTLEAGETNPEILKAIRLNKRFMMVASALIGKPPKIEVPSSEIVYGEVTRIMNCMTKEPSLIFRDIPADEIDYTQFLIRGHYTRSEELKHFFRVMSWLGLVEFNMKNDDHLRAVIILSKVLHENAQCSRNWKNIYDVTTLFVGPSVNPGPQLVYDAVTELLGKSFTLEQALSAENLPEIRNLIFSTLKVSNSFGEEDETENEHPPFSFMGKRYTVDGDLMQRIADKLSEYPAERWLPSLLDFASVMGSETAVKILRGKSADARKGYRKMVNNLRKTWRERVSKEVSSTLYYKWLMCMQTMSRNDYRLPGQFFTFTEGWKLKNLNTMMAILTELKHDTVLYGFTGSAECGWGPPEWVPDWPKGYVEPNIEFYSGLGELLTVMQKELKNRQILTKQAEDTLEKYRKLVSFLESVVLKEMDGQGLTVAEYEKIHFIGGWLEDVTIAIMNMDIAHSYKLLLNGKEDICLVTDVFTTITEPRSVLQEAVGYPYSMLIVVKIDGKYKLMRGGVFSYYEFLWPAADRLTDEKWRKIMKSPEAPDIPSWLRNLFPTGKAKELPQPKYIYTEGC